jgi:hypothetical protein
MQWTLPPTLKLSLPLTPTIIHYFVRKIRIGRYTFELNGCFDCSFLFKIRDSTARVRVSRWDKPSPDDWKSGLLASMKNPDEVKYEDDDFCVITGRISTIKLFIYKFHQLVLQVIFYCLFLVVKVWF